MIAGLEGFPAEDRELLQRAATWDDCSGLNDCSPERILQLAREHGLDFATALLYDRVLRTLEHRTFFQQVQSSKLVVAEGPPLVGIIPGAFYQQHKNTGADGARVAAILQSIGCRVELVPVESFGALAKNASIVAEWLSLRSNQPIALISLSKGSADMKIALGLPNAVDLFQNVLAWISLSGLPQGTPLVGWLRGQPLRKLGVRLLLWARNQRYSVIEELRSEPNGPLSIWPSLPPHLRLIHVVGFPLRRHLAHPWASRGYKRVVPFGPTDGGGFLLADVSKLPGTVFPVWGADHYLQPAWDATSLLRRMFVAAISPRAHVRQANQSETQPSRPPAKRSRA